MSLVNPQGPIERRHGAKLPHWTANAARYFVTFRLCDSLPRPIFEAYARQRDTLLAAYRETNASPAPYEFTPGDLERRKQLFSETMEHYLDAGMGACWMRDPRIADLVQHALLHFDGQRYTLRARCVMPNHVHVVFQARAGWTLPSILHSWKSNTAKEANKLLNRRGEFWQSESYVHLVRNAHDPDHCIQYTLNNPAKAGLRGWRWAGQANAPA